MENEEYETIDLLEVLNAVRQHLAVLILCTLAAALAGGGWAALRRTVSLPGGWGGIVLGAGAVSAVYILLLPLLGGVTAEDWRQLPRRRRTA